MHLAEGEELELVAQISNFKQEKLLQYCFIYAYKNKFIELNTKLILPKDGKPLRIIAGKYEWNGAREVGDCSVRIVRADINYDDGEL